MLTGLLEYFVRRKRITSTILYGMMLFLPRLSSAILAVIYSSVFSLGDYGVYGILASLMGIIPIVLDFGIPAGILRNYHQEKKRALTYAFSIIKCAQLLMLAALPCIAVALYFTSRWIHIGLDRFWLYMPMILAAAFLDRNGEAFAAVSRALENVYYYAAGRLAQGITVTFVGVVLVFGLRLGVAGALAAMLAGALAKVVCYRLILMRHGHLQRGSLRWKDLREGLKFGFPLIPHQLASWGRQLGLRPVLLKTVPLYTVGLFSFATSFSSLPGLFSGLVDLVLTPIYFRKRDSATSSEFDDRVMLLAKALMAAVFPVCLAAILFGSDVIGLFSSPRYLAAGPISAILFCATFIRIQQAFLTRQIQFLRKTWVMPLVSGPFAILSLVLTFVLAKPYGLEVIAWMVVVFDVSAFAILALVIRSFEPVQYPVKSGLLLTGVLVSLAIASRCKMFLWEGHADIIRAGLVFMATILCFMIWIFPKRIALVQLAAG